VTLDNVLLTSPRYGLTGRPDRLVRTGDIVIPEEWKSARRVSDGHRAQMGVYFLLIEDQLAVVPPHGFIVCGDGSRHRIENTPELRGWVLELAAAIREKRAAVEQVIAVQAKPWLCRPCGMRVQCAQARE
jgi:CRISPR/Cas system-associated exonuclease Cas4 (RecB family)